MVVGLQDYSVIIKWTNERREMMTSACLQEKAKLILTYPHKSKFNRLAYLAIVVTFLVVRLLHSLRAYGTDFADKMLILIVLIYLPLLIYFMGYYLFINGVKLEIYENDVANCLMSDPSKVPLSISSSCSTKTLTHSASNSPTAQARK